MQHTHHDNEKILNLIKRLRDLLEQRHSNQNELHVEVNKRELKLKAESP